jgi:hypothetical protein
MPYYFVWPPDDGSLLADKCIQQIRAFFFFCLINEDQQDALFFLNLLRYSILYMFPTE